MDRNISRGVLEKALYDTIPDISGKQIWIWGAGNTSQLYQEGLRRLHAEGFPVEEGYIDRDPAKVGTEFNGKPVIAPEQLKEYKKVCVLINTIQSNVIEEVSRYLNEVGQEWYLLDEVILKLHREEVLQCYDILEDEHSKNVYALLTLWRLTGKKPEGGMEYKRDAYFALECFTKSSWDEVFIDCGAYTGDTLTEYIEQRKGIFKKIVSFEPDRDNYIRLEQEAEKMKSRWKLSDDRIALFPYGVGAKNTEGIFERYEDNMGLGSKFVPQCSSEEGNCRIVSLDEFLTEPYTFLKADIESFEYQMLLGAENGIKKFRPLLAVCIYHNVVDFYSVILLIKSMVPQYKLAVRQHSGKLDETVVYAWV